MPVRGKQQSAANRHSRRSPWRRPGQCVPSRPGRAAGFTLVELLGVVAVIGILAALGVTSSRTVLDKGRNSQAVAEILEIQVQVLEFKSSYDSVPVSLVGIGRQGVLDPWGRAYRYGRVADPKYKQRKDRFLQPLNSDFDLYSMGADGESVAPITAPESQDDIIRANDGRATSIQWKP